MLLISILTFQFNKEVVSKLEIKRRPGGAMQVQVKCQIPLVSSTLTGYCWALPVSNWGQVLLAKCVFGRPSSIHYLLMHKLLIPHTHIFSPSISLPFSLSLNRFTATQRAAALTHSLLDPSAHYGSSTSSVKLISCYTYLYCPHWACLNKQLCKPVQILM